MELLCCFGFNGCFYEVFVNKLGKIYCRKIGKRKNKSEYSDKRIIKRVVQKIFGMRFALFDSIKYRGTDLDIYIDLIENEKYVVKKENGKNILCDYSDCRVIYDLYNNPVIYNYDYYEDDPFSNIGSFSDDNPSSNNDSFSNDDPFSNNDSFSNDNLSSTNDSFSNDDPFLSFDDLSESKGFSNISSEPVDDLGESSSESYIEKRLGEKREKEKKKKKKANAIKLTVCGFVIAAIIIPTSFFVSKLFKKNDDYDIPDQDVIVEEVEEEDEIFNEIMRLVKDEEPWVIEQVKEQYFADKNDTKKQQDLDEMLSENPQNEDLLSKDAKRIFECIRNNPNLKDSEKNIILNSFSKSINLYLKYCDNINKLCDKFSSVKIVYDIKDEEELKKLGAWGEYESSENIITIYKDEHDVLTHEVMHMFGDFGLGITTGKLSEGYTEMFNPKRLKNEYNKEQLMDIILEQVYGQDFMRKSFFNQNLFGNIYDRYDIDTQDSNKYWDLIRSVNSFLIKYEDKSIIEINKNEEYKNELYELLSDLKGMYKELNGDEWENNEVLNICFDKLTFSKTSEASKSSKDHNMSVTDIYIDSDGDYSYREGKSWAPIIDIYKPTSDDYLSDKTVRNTDIYSKSFDIQSEGKKIK